MILQYVYLTAVEFSPGYGLMHTLFCASLQYVHTFTMWCFYLHLKILANNILSKYNPNILKGSLALTDNIPTSICQKIGINTVDFTKCVSSSSYSETVGNCSR